MDFFLTALILPAYLVGKFLVTNDRGQQEPPKAIRQAVIIGLLGLVVAGFANQLVAQFVLGFDSVESILFNGLSTQSLRAFYFLALSEELIKFLPLAFHVYKKTYFNEISDGVIYFAIAGLAFGVFETFFYALSFGGTGIILLRLALGLFLHAGTTAIAGYSLAQYKLNQKGAIWVGISFFVAVMLHALYNFLIGGGGLYTIAGMAVSFLVSSMIFVLFYRATVQDNSIRQQLT